MQNNLKLARPGFTRIELLVAIAIGLLLAANSAPAVMQARETARRAQCKNNLKQLGLALHNYHDAWNMFPPGYVVRNWDSSSHRGFGWMTSILPFVDQSPVFNRLNFSEGSFMDATPTPDEKKDLMTLVPVYRCPSDQMTDLNTSRGGWPTSNYSGNAGHRPFPRLTAGIVTDFWPGQIPSPYHVNRPGVFGPNSSIKFRDLIDGSTNIIMVGERGLSSLAGIWPGITSATHENDALTETSHLSRPNAGLTSFSSQHADGLHILLCDGSVRWILDSIDSQPCVNPLLPQGIYQKLGCCADDQIIGEF